MNYFNYSILEDSTIYLYMYELLSIITQRNLSINRFVIHAKLVSGSWEGGKNVLISCIIKQNDVKDNHLFIMK